MTKSDVVDAFIRGDLDRRGFIKKLTAVGVSSAAAMAYAGSLVQNAAAAPQNGAGFITRGFMQDAEYGPAVPIEDLPAAVQAVVTSALAVANTVTELLSDFEPGDFAEAGLDEADREVLQDIVSQISEHAQAIAAFRGLPAPAAAGAGAPSQGTPGGGLLERLAGLADALNETAGKYAALIPAMDDPEERELFTQIAIVAGRHAAMASYLAGNNPFPGAFEEPIDPVA